MDWAGRPQWRVLATAFGNGDDFLATLQAWRADARRPGLLHYVGLDAHSGFQPGLTPGLHRFAFEGGRVLLTLGVGDRGLLLRELDFTADAVRLAGSGFDLGTLKAISRLCREGTALEAGDLP